MLYMLLLSPFLGYAYSVWFSLPKTITHFFTFFSIGTGLIFIFKKKHINIPLWAKFLLIFALYKLIWNLIIGSDKHFLTVLFYQISDFAVFFIMIMVYSTSFSDKFINRSITIMKLIVILAALVSVVQIFNIEFLNPRVYAGEDSGIDENMYTFRRVSIFGFVHPVALGLAFVPLLSVLVGYLLYTNNKYYILYLFLGIIVAFLSNTRFIIIGSIIVTLQIVAYNKSKIRGYIRYFIVFGILMLLALTTLDYLGYDFKEWFKQRLMVEGSIQGTTRYKAIDNFLRFFPQKPIFGTGTMTEEIREASRAIGSSQIHVGYLAMLVYYGLVGCFFLFGSWFLLIKRFYKTARVTNYWGSFFGFLTFLWSFATMNLDFLLFSGIIFSMVFDKYFNDRERINNFNELQVSITN